MREYDDTQPTPDDGIAKALHAAMAKESELPAAIDVRTAWSITVHRYGMNPRPGQRQSARSELTPRSPMAFRLAIAVAGCIAIPLLWLHNSSRNGALTGQPTHSATYTTHSAERRTIHLPDGSQLLLAPETRLQYTESRNGARTLDLQGEAYFTVTHDATRPFVVRAGGVATEVLGTAFNVRRYEADSVTEVAVVDGKVSARGLRSSVLLTAGMAAGVPDTSEARSVAASVDAITEWTRGRLIFRDAPLPDVLRTVGRWCGYELQLADSTMNAEQVTTVLYIGRPDKTLKMLEELLDVVPAVDGQVITLYPRQTSQLPASSKRMGRDTTSVSRG